jgi:tRNA nucleotidyltransferase (CCA-adding enzyme)
LAPGSTELNELQDRAEEVKMLLRGKFKSARIKEARSKRKGTMIKASYDLDITCYFPHDDTAAVTLPRS